MWPTTEFADLSAVTRSEGDHAAAAAHGRVADRVGNLDHVRR
jgi:hypothetical protein